MYPGPTNYEAEFSKLKAQELPYFEAYNACGSCGKQGLQDAAWFNFLSYIQVRSVADLPNVSEHSRQIKVIAHAFVHTRTHTPT